MNYFAHALHCLDDPYQCAGVATPDWLGIFRPRVRCRSRHAEPYLEAGDHNVAALAQGIVRHHADDGWFHETPAFAQLSVDFAGRIRRATHDADGMRPSFVGHILVELLLDATLIEDNPMALEAYYESLAQVSPRLVAEQVSAMSGQNASDLETLIPKFIETRFLEDYEDNSRLCFRLNQVMRRVGLNELPAEFQELLPAARADVRSRQAELLEQHSASNE